jgi:putative hydrolase of the HAD superfamily
VSAPGRAVLLPRVLLLDLDDTILDDSGGSDGCWRTVCLEAALERRGIDRDELRAAIEATRRWYWSDVERHRVGRHDLRAASTRIAALALARLGIDDPALAGRIGHRYQDLRDAAVRPLPGAIAMLDRLRAAGVTLGLVTNGAAAPQRAKVERFDLAARFSYVGIEGEVGVGKPCLGAYLAALRALGCAARDAWMVGDNLEWDVRAPQRLGIRGVWINPAGLAAGDGAQPDRTVAALADLLG